MELSHLFCDIKFTELTQSRRIPAQKKVKMIYYVTHTIYLTSVEGP